MSSVEVRLQGEFDARVWAQEFVGMVRENPDIPTDEGTMISWFANAIMAGYDHHAREDDGEPEPPFDFTREHDGSLSLDSAVYQALGAASVCWDNMMGTGVFHSDRAKEIGDRLLAFIRDGQ